MRALLVDPSTECDALANGLRGRGIDVRVARHVRDALNVLLAWDASVILVESFVPGLERQEVVRMLLGIRPRARVIVYSEYNDTPSCVEAMRLGAENVLDKPQPLSELLRAIEPELAVTPIRERRPVTLADHRRGCIMLALQRTGGDKSRAARELGIDRRTLQRMLQKKCGGSRAQGGPAEARPRPEEARNQRNARGSAGSEPA